MLRVKSVTVGHIYALRAMRPNYYYYCNNNGNAYDAVIVASAIAVV